jgi:hypothetical protein
MLIAPLGFWNKPRTLAWFMLIVAVADKFNSTLT